MGRGVTARVAENTGCVRAVTAAWCLFRILVPGDREKTSIRWMKKEVVAIVISDVMDKRKNNDFVRVSGYWV